ncbi:hypothetical protein GTA08_BOTSDO03452 [Botryosphaeria dothidea]|uniref:Uncharacterized protein n=1 Tax=Botryosphaeria dothidea TaxID=55169 RepID=A0A8H4IY62_9PEZI|nr:hypothetical protein GTA08_BOTSDO03452 [Botryosphaeria dothidea]
MSNVSTTPEQSYARLALDTKRGFFPSKFSHPWTDVPKGIENGSVAIIDFHKAASASIAKPSGADELRTFLEKSSASNRLIVLEDLDQRYGPLLLVDPVLENAVHSSYANNPSDDPAHNLALQHSDLSDGRIPLPARFSVSKLPKDPQQWQNPPPRPLSISLFDNLVHIYTTHPHNTTSDTMTATIVIRNLLLSTWQGVIKAKEMDYYYLWEKTSFSKAHYASPGSWYSAWERNWQSEYFNALTYHMMTVMNRMRDVDDTFRMLGLASAAASPSSPGQGPPTFSPRELRDWQALRAHATALHERFSHTLATYEQRASVEESLLANKQARNVGRLSALATVLVPFSVIAGIFSMSGEFAAGEDLFWVFWLLAPTVSGMLMVWLFFEKIVRILRGTWVSDGAVLPLHEKVK